MAHFNYHAFQNLKDGEILKIKFQGREEFCSEIRKEILQPYHPHPTPNNNLRLAIIRDVELFKTERWNDENIETLYIPESSIVSCEKALLKF